VQARIVQAVPQVLGKAGILLDGDQSALGPHPPQKVLGEDPETRPVLDHERGPREVDEGADPLDGEAGGRGDGCDRRVLDQGLDVGERAHAPRLGRPAWLLAQIRPANQGSQLIRQQIGGRGLTYAFAISQHLTPLFVCLPHCLL